MSYDPSLSPRGRPLWITILGECYKIVGIILLVAVGIAAIELMRIYGNARSIERQIAEAEYLQTSLYDQTKYTFIEEAIRFRLEFPPDTEGCTTNISHWIEQDKAETEAQAIIDTYETLPEEIRTIRMLAALERAIDIHGTLAYACEK